MRIILVFNECDEGEHEFFEEMQIEIDQIPRIGDRINAMDMLNDNDWERLRLATTRRAFDQEAHVWAVILRKDDAGFYYEIRLDCTDK